MGHLCRTVEKSKYHVKMISAEELLCKGQSTSIILERFGVGLCNKLEYLKFLQKTDQSLPRWYVSDNLTASSQKQRIVA